MTTLATPGRAHILSRVVASILGSYVVTWGFITLTVAVAVALGLPYGEAVTLASLLAFLVFLAAFCWAFVAASLARVWAVLCGGGVILMGSASLLSRFVL